MKLNTTRWYLLARILRALSILAVAAVLAYGVLYAALVVDRLAHWCERYPESLADCRER